MKSPRLSIIIVNWNGRTVLDDCLSSIHDLDGSACYETIVVDNASTDGSSDFIRERFPWVRLIQSDRNLGFAGGNNLGARHAVGELLLLLNNDTVLLTDVQSAIEQFDKDPTLGVVGGRLFYGDRRQQPSFGYDPAPLRLALSWLGMSRCAALPSIFRNIESDGRRYDTRQAGVAWVSGACMFTRASLLKRLGGFDEQYFMYVEDVDYCKRVRQAGRHVAYSPDVELIHLEGGGKPWIGEEALVNSMKSYLIYTRKFHGAASALLIQVALGAIMFARSMAFGVSALFIRSATRSEKTLAYGRVARLLLSQVGMKRVVSGIRTSGL